VTEFRNAIVRRPCRSIINGLTSVSLGKPDYKKALEQHALYVEALKNTGLNVLVLDQDDLHPDSTFIEDVALCTPVCAIITNPGAESRKNETRGIREVLQEYYEKIEEIVSPGTLEAGDVMMTGSHFFIGISARTNSEGANQLIRILENYSMTGSTISLEKMLHLKSGASYLENNIMLVSGELTKCKDLERFNRIIVDPEESYSSNSLWINGTVLIPAGFPETRRKIENAGYRTIILDVSEFRKVDGGLSCLSLRF
jgi:dimethylargininase